MSLFSPLFARSLLLSSALVFVHASQAESLLDIYQQAQANDHIYKAAVANYSATKETKNIRRADLLPKLNASGEWQDSTTESDNDFVAQDTVSTGYTLTLEQPLFDASAWKSYKQGTSIAKAAKAQLGAAKQSLIIRTATAYFDALRAVDNYKTAIAEEKALSSQLDQVKQRYEVGLTAITEVHEAQAAYDSVFAERLQAEGQLGIQFEALEVLTGRPYSQLAPLNESFAAKDPQPAAREAWVEKAKAGNFTLQVAKLTAESAKYTAQARKAGHLPTITASARFTDSDSEGNSIGADGTVEVETQEVTVRLNMPIFNGGSVSANRRQAYQEYIEKKEDYNQAKRDVVQNARTRHLSVVTSAATVRARSQAIVSNQSALDATQAGYDVGTRDFVDVLNAQRNLFRAQRDYFNSLYTHILDDLNLKETAGTLGDQDIVALNQQLMTTAPVSRFVND